MLGYLETTRYPSAGSCHVSAVDEGRAARQRNRLPDLGHGHRCRGQIAETIQLQNRASKGTTGGRTIPLHPDLQDALTALQTARGDAPRPEQAVLFSERGGGLSPATVRLWFHRLYTSLKMDGCSSHSGRRTFITRAARKVSQVGGSLRDVPGTRRPYEPGHDPTLHRGGYGSQAQARRAPRRRLRHRSPCGEAHHEADV